MLFFVCPIPTLSYLIVSNHFAIYYEFMLVTVLKVPVYVVVFIFEVCSVDVLCSKAVFSNSFQVHTIAQDWHKVS